MTFSSGGRAEGGRVRTRRGAVAGGGIGLGAVAIFLIAQLAGVDLSGVLPQDGGTGGETGVVEDCSAEQANTDRDCRYSFTMQALDDYWAEVLPAEGLAFEQPGAWAFEGATTTACGQASSSTGPFYCPSDGSIHMDLGFFDLLQSRFGASGGSLAQMYVTAHEYGHHVQNLTGVMAEADRSGAGAGSDSVRVELQADCYAGMWVGDAASRVDPDTGVTFLDPITPDQLADALSAAEAVGDDHIQERSGGEVDPHTWTHGSSEQRRRWFMTGYEDGTLAACDTFAVDDL